MVAPLNSMLPPISVSATLQTLSGPQPTGPQSTSSAGSSYVQLGAGSYTSSNGCELRVIQRFAADACGI